MSPNRANHAALARPKGFTLIELMVVIFIIGILIAAVLTIVPKVKRSVYGAQTQAQLSAMANAIQQYDADYKSYPGPLANYQLFEVADGGGAVPYINDPAGGAALALQGYPPTTYTNVNYQPTTFKAGYISGPQNLTLGLLGGLEVMSTNGGAPFSFVYNPQDILADGVTPAPRGPASLNVTSPHRQQAYIQVKSGDLSVPNHTLDGGNGASFADEANRYAGDASNQKGDAMIPVFLDKFANPLPFLYFRTNVGGTAVVGFRNKDRPSGADLTDATLAAFGGTPVSEIAQYDLYQNLQYTLSGMGTNTSRMIPHGLTGLGTPTDFRDPIDYQSGQLYAPANGGSNAIAYFKDPTLNAPYDAAAPNPPAPPCNTHLGVARQKDGYILISAGPDRIYGTRDDVVFPGPLLP